MIERVTQRGQGQFAGTSAGRLRNGLTAPIRIEVPNNKTDDRGGRMLAIDAKPCGCIARAFAHITFVAKETSRKGRTAVMIRLK